VGVKQRGLRPCNELNLRERLHVADQLLKPAECALLRTGRPLRIDLPLLARRIGPCCKVQIPELAMDELAGVKIEADEPAARLPHLFVEPADPALALLEVVPVLIGPELQAFSGVEDVEKPAIVKGLAV